MWIDIECVETIRLDDREIFEFLFFDEYLHFASRLILWIIKNRFIDLFD